MRSAQGDVSGPAPVLVRKRNEAAKAWEWHLSTGELHRDDDLPAVERDDGTREYYQRGLHHRGGDKPAIEGVDGRLVFYQHGVPCRAGDEPASVQADGTVVYYKDGKIGRDGDQPAVIKADGTRIYYQDGEIHRDGDEPAAVFANGQREWTSHGKLHRDGDKPAIESADGAIAFYQHGLLHRGGGQPARVNTDGTREYFQLGKRHRAGNLPAVERPDGTCEFWQYDRQVQKQAAHEQLTGGPVKRAKAAFKRHLDEDTSARRFAGETTNTIHMYQTSVPVYGRPTYHPGPGLKTYLSVDGQHWIEVPHPPRTYTRELAQALGEAGPGSSLIQGAKVVNLPVDPIAPTDTEIVRLIAEPAAARRR